MNRRWLITKTNREFLKYLSAKASISPSLAQVLVNRGIKDAEAIKEFLKPELNYLHDPYLLPDMQKAVDRLKTAMEKKDKVFIHGDYDVDGLTSTAILVYVLGKLGLETSYHIPNRITEGYGLSSTGIQKAKEWGADLIITVDCGISSEEAVQTAVSINMDVIVTDHHVPPEKLPNALAVIDPHRSDSLYPFKHLAGVGVAFKLAQAVLQALGDRDVRWEDLLDLVALGTVADSVPLTGENRIFVTYGLDQINHTSCRIGLQALKEGSGIDRKVRAGLLSYTLIPRINSAGRLSDAGEVVRLFLTEDKEEARRIASILNEQNRKRQKIEAEVLSSALEMIDPERVDSAIILSSPEWHPGVIGIVASRLVERFHRPVFLFSEKDLSARGSARGVPPIHLYNAIDECADLLTGYGGHRQAAGLSLPLDNLPSFIEKIKHIISRDLPEEDMTQVLEIDATVNFSDINFNLINELSLLEPYGEANREPTFGAKGIEIVNRRVLKDRHLKMQLKQDSVNVDTIGFSMGGIMEKIDGAPYLDIAFVPCINEWNGTRNIQLNLKAVRPGV
jgi:single-stranded-DNA-specific exonuclease